MAITQDYSSHQELAGSLTSIFLVLCLNRKFSSNPKDHQGADSNAIAVGSFYSSQLRSSAHCHHAGQFLVERRALNIYQCQAFRKQQVKEGCECASIQLESYYGLQHNWLVLGISGKFKFCFPLHWWSLANGACNLGLQVCLECNLEMLVLLGV